MDNDTNYSFFDTMLKRLARYKAGVFTEVAEIKRNLSIYLQDPWNFFDALALVMLAGGFFVRLTDGGSPWGRALYALSAPLVFSRILFFVQILQFQGPMIQVGVNQIRKHHQSGYVCLSFDTWNSSHYLCCLPRVDAEQDNIFQIRKSQPSLSTEDKK